MNSLNNKRGKEQLNIDVDYLSADESLIDQVMKSRDDRANWRLYTYEIGLGYLQKKADLEDE